MDACRAPPVERSTYHYRSRRAGQAQLTERIKEIAATRVRYGYRRIHVPLRREGWRMLSASIGCIKRWACNCGIRRSSAGLRPSCGKVAGRRHDQMRPGRWTSCMINLSTSDRNEAARVDDCRHVLPFLAGDRTAVYVPRRRRGGGAGKNRARGKVPGGHPSGPGL